MPEISVITTSIALQVVEPQVLDFALFVARSFTASDSGGTAVANSNNNGKHRTSLALPSNIDLRISSTGALTAGTRTVDANAIGMVAGYSSGAGQGIAPALNNVFGHDAGDYSLVLAQNEGILIQMPTAMGAVGVGTLYVNLELAEASSY